MDLESARSGRVTCAATVASARDTTTLSLHDVFRVLLRLTVGVCQSLLDGQPAARAQNLGRSQPLHAFSKVGIIRKVS